MNTTAETSALEDKLSRYLTELSDSGQPLFTGNMGERREKASTFLRSSGLPHPKHEEYKYTSLTKLTRKHFDLGEALGNDYTSDIDPSPYYIPEAEGDRIVLINGIYSSQHSSVSEQLSITSLADAANEESLLKYFGTHAFASADGWAALNTATSKEGVVIKAGTAQKEGKPVYIYHITDSRSLSPVAQPHHLFVAERSANLKVVEVFTGEGDNPAFVNTATEIMLLENAHVEHYKLGLEQEAVIHAGHTMVYQSRDSHYHDVTINLKGGVVRNNLNITLDAENCESHMIGLYLPTGKQHIDNHTEVDHRKPHSFSNELYKGVMSDRSTAVFNGKIFVQQDAQKTNAFQSNKNLLLSDEASINTKPQLEIWADDVKCSHGATTGQLDSEQVFYLMSRGLNKDQAKAMLLGAFASEVTAQINIPALRNYVEELVGKTLNS